MFSFDIDTFVIPRKITTDRIKRVSFLTTYDANDIHFRVNVKIISKPYARQWFVSRLTGSPFAGPKIKHASRLNLFMVVATHPNTLWHLPQTMAKTTKELQLGASCLLNADTEWQ